jgi:hypothetical protein
MKRYSSLSHFAEFETMIGALDAENLEYFFLGDINVDFTPTANSSCKNTITEPFDIYGLHQLIGEPTRITEKSTTMIDLCVTNSLSTTVDSGVIIFQLVSTRWSILYAKHIMYRQGQET